MSSEEGNIYEGRVIRLAKFGAFVALPDGQTGLVHISEVADEYVKNIEKHLSIGDKVTVYVMKAEEDGKIALSIRKGQSAEKTETADKQRKAKESPAAFLQGTYRFLEDSEKRLNALEKKIQAKQ